MSAEQSRRFVITSHDPEVHGRLWLEHLTGEGVARAVLRDITTLAEQAGTLTDERLRTRLISCLTRFDQASRCGADQHAPAGHRPDNEVPGAPPVPPAANNPDTGTAR